MFVNNFVLSQFLGICPFMGVSKKVESAVGMAAAVVFVITMASIITIAFGAHSTTRRNESSPASGAGSRKGACFVAATPGAISAGMKDSILAIRYLTVCVQKIPASG